MGNYKEQMDIFSFLAIWFNNLKKSVFKVELINQKNDLKPLENKLDDINKSLKNLPSATSGGFGHTFYETYVKDIRELVSKIRPKDTQKVEVTNLRIPETKFPSHMSVSGDVRVTNLPEVQKVTGDVSVSGFEKFIQGLQVVVDAINDLKLDMAQSFKGIGGAFGVTGSREALKVTDGTKSATITTTGAKNALDVNVASGSTNNTEYTEGDTDTSITGIAVMWEDASDTLRTVSAAKPLPVDITDSSIAATQSGTWTVQPGNTANTTAWKVDASSVAVPVTDNSGSLTVDGTVAFSNTTIAVTNAGTFATQATLQTGTNSIGKLGANSGVDIGDVDVTSIAAGDNNIGNVDIVTVPAPLSTTGGGTEATALRVTVANDSTGVLSVDDNGGALTVDGTVAFSNTTIAVTNTGTFATQATLQAGSAAIGKLAANSGVDIGDVDVTSIATGTNAIGRVGHDITGIGHGVTTVTTAGTDVALAGSTACKKVVIQAQTDNTNVIAVGATGVDATIATGTGVVLFPGDAFELEIDNLADVFIDSLVNGEGVRYTYFT